VANGRWFITGVSSGFGRLLAQAALDRGDMVAGTVRRPEQAAEFAALAPGRAHPVRLDVTDRSRIEPAIDEALAAMGGIDVLVNNAGYGLVGALEESGSDEIEHALGTNLSGPIYLTRAALPALRQSRGFIVNISSLVGLVGVGGLSVYCAAKHGLEGLSEALRMELAPFGIRVMLVEPGSFRTNFASGSERLTERQMEIYKDTAADMARSGMRRIGGNQAGDPAKAVAAILAAMAAPNPPLRLVLGKDALESIEKKIARLQANLAEWRETALGTAF
jgi:NAD(P)-dependent dehydrogenase (short-subunit alcohol dehydrogenase family)